MYNKTVQATENKSPMQLRKKKSLVYQSYSILLQAQQKLNTKKNRYQGRAEKEGVYTLKIINSSTGYPS